MRSQQILEYLEADLLAARIAREQTKVDALQSVLTRITNAEAVPVDAVQASRRVHIGVGTSEAERRVLSEQDIRQIIQDEINEIQDAITEIAKHGEHPYADELRQKADILAVYLAR